MLRGDLTCAKAPEEEVENDQGESGRDDEDCHEQADPGDPQLCRRVGGKIRIE